MGGGGKSRVAVPRGEMLERGERWRKRKRGQKGEGATRTARLGGGTEDGRDEETKKERIELLPTQRLSYLMIYSAVPESR